MKRLDLALKRHLYALTEPRSASEDERRRELVLNTLLLGVLTLSLAVLVLVSISFVMKGRRFEGASPVLVVLVVGVVLGLYSLSRRGHVRLATYLFVACFAVIAMMVCLTWGIVLPAGLLMFALVIVMAGTLGGGQFLLVTTVSVAVILLALGFLQSVRITHPDLTWMNQGGGGVGDALGYVLICGVIALVAWLSNREVERSLERARMSEADLARQRDLLEVRVEERTRELKEAQLEKLLQLNRFADFGRISSGFFHDIINPLTAVSLNLEQLSMEQRSELLQRAIAGIRHIESFAITARKQVQGRDHDLGLFLVADETKGVVAILDSKARGAKVVVVCDLDDSLQLYGNPVKFHKLVSNLVANAIDAYDGMPAEGRVVEVTARRSGKMVKLAVKDRGSGILPEHLAWVFDPFFTTKPVEKGTGIGLLIVKRIVEEDFGGTVKVTSTKARGTVFTITIRAAPE